MRSGFLRLISLSLSLLLVLSSSVPVRAYERGDGAHLDLSGWIDQRIYREYVQMMIDYHIRSDKQVQSALDGGFAAVFLFDGCSNHMQDPAYRDLTYYRITGVCVVVKLDENGKPRMIYFNDNCTTIPDRPLDYGAWSLPGVGSVGPATIRDGTYQLYSVLHKGAYQALNVRADYYDSLVDAIYMKKGGFTPSRASEINVHTRTGNHTISRGMWSAGCPLVGAGKPWEFWKLMESVYFTSFDDFEIDTFVGTLTIDRQCLRYELYNLYEDMDAVDAILECSQEVQPEAYLSSCKEVTYEKRRSFKTTAQASLMTLPCGNGADARSIEFATVPEGTELEALSRITNAKGEKWYAVLWDRTLCYVPSALVRRTDGFF